MRRFDTPPYYLTAYGLAVKNGFRGTEEEWLESLHGEPAELESSVTEYQAGPSAKEAPAGEWSTEIPEVAQGEYLWSRTTKVFNTGSPVVSYSVARMGMDGERGEKGDKGDKGNQGDKGDKGDTGDPAKLVSAVVEHQSGDSGTSVPSGAWSTSVPEVAQGGYLWTRTICTFNTGEPVVSYSVARMGMDGNGAILTVAGHRPGDDGDIPLNAEDVGARPDDWMPTAADVGARPDTWMPTAAEVGARPDTWTPTAADVGALPSAGGTVAGDLRFKAGENETEDLVFERPTTGSYEARMDVLGSTLRIYRYDISGGYKQILGMALADGSVAVCGSADFSGPITLEGTRQLFPAMGTNTEYLTAEYWRGCPVCAMLVDMGTLPNSTYKSVSIGISPSSVISINGYGYNAADGAFMMLPTVHGGSVGAVCFVNSAGYLVVETYRDMSAWTAKFIVKYVKGATA